MGSTMAERSPHGQTREDLQADQEEQRLWDEFLTRYSDLADVHGHEHGPGVLLCYDCAESAGADKTLLEKLRAAGSMPAA